MTSVPALIMAVPWEMRRAIRARQLSAQAAPAAIVWDSNQNAFDTWVKTLTRIGDEPAIVLEDDVTLTEGWREKIDAAIPEHAQSLIQFFSLPRKADTQGSRWEPGRSFAMNQCYYLPPGMAVDLLSAAERWRTARPEHPTGYDVLMADYLKRTGQRYWLHLPSLVQHESWPSEINRRRPRNRQSASFQP